MIPKTHALHVLFVLSMHYKNVTKYFLVTGCVIWKKNMYYEGQLHFNNYILKYGS